jgi:hypothetical protein
MLILRVPVERINLTKCVNRQIFGGRAKKNLKIGLVRLYFTALFDLIFSKSPCLSEFDHSKATSLIFTCIPRNSLVLYYRSVLFSRWVRVYVRIRPCHQPPKFQIPYSTKPMSYDLACTIWWPHSARLESRIGKVDPASREWMSGGKEVPRRETSKLVQWIIMKDGEQQTFVNSCHVMTQPHPKPSRISKPERISQ